MDRLSHLLKSTPCIELELKVHIPSLCPVNAAHPRLSVAQGELAYLLFLKACSTLCPRNFL